MFAYLYKVERAKPPPPKHSFLFHFVADTPNFPFKQNTAYCHIFVVLTCSRTLEFYCHSRSTAYAVPVLRVHAIDARVLVNFILFENRP